MILFAASSLVLIFVFTVHVSQPQTSVLQTKPFNSRCFVVILIFFAVMILGNYSNAVFVIRILSIYLSVLPSLVMMLLKQIDAFNCFISFPLFNHFDVSFILTYARCKAFSYHFRSQDSVSATSVSTCCSSSASASMAVIFERGENTNSNTNALHLLYVLHSRLYLQ